MYNNATGSQERLASQLTKMVHVPIVVDCHLATTYIDVAQSGYHNHTKCLCERQNV